MTSAAIPGAGTAGEEAGVSITVIARCLGGIGGLVGQTVAVGRVPVPTARGDDHLRATTGPRLVEADSNFNMSKSRPGGILVPPGKIGLGRAGSPAVAETGRAPRTLLARVGAV